MRFGDQLEREDEGNNYTYIVFEYSLSGVFPLEYWLTYKESSEWSPVSVKCTPNFNSLPDSV